MDGRGPCLDRATISVKMASRKFLCEIFFPPHEDKNVTVDNDQVQQVGKGLFYTSMLCRPYQHHIHLQSCWRKNLVLKAVKWKTVAKVGVAPLLPPTLVMRNVYPRRCPNPLRFLVFDSETADEPVSHMNPHSVELQNLN
jgi:hypothetical protein